MTSEKGDFIHMSFICPCCKELKAGADTPIEEIYDMIKKLNLHLSANDIDDFAGRFKKTEPVTGNPAGILYHTTLWACNSCMEKGKALIGDYSRQNYGLGGPTLMYVELKYRCRSCSEDFIFSAKEQQYWYEELGFLVDSHPVNCPDCRKKIRFVKHGAKRLAELYRLERKLTAEELVEMAEIYEAMGAEEKARIAHARALKASDT
ncbi:MAG TPA: zinc-ribbon domain containing protein [Spirochaetota bacterium]|nr:zinc-ribbon domain containing protein [Spirochaetota bacterium]HPJ35860.1 zinc-ribbon domain containing protein [Spirochaetota bacterium]